MGNVIKEINKYISSATDKIGAIQEIKNLLFELSPLKDQPVDNVKWVPFDRVKPNDYNPNKVAKIEMKLLFHSIQYDNYTQPIVTVFDEKTGDYNIVDGFHRYYIMKTFKEIYDRTGGLLPVTVINKDINDNYIGAIATKIIEFDELNDVYDKMGAEVR